MVQEPQFWTLLTCECASHHNAVHFYDISTFESGANLWCFYHFDFEMFFAPQRRALFQHLNFQKCSEAEVFCIFWRGNVPRATTLRTFSKSQLPKVVGTCVCFLPFWVRNVLCAKAPYTFWTSQLPKLAPGSYFLWLFLFWLFLFWLFLFSASFHLCFSSVHIIGSLTSKLPSTIHIRIDVHHVQLLQLSCHHAFDSICITHCSYMGLSGWKLGYIIMIFHMNLSFWGIPLFSDKLTEIKLINSKGCRH